jgi:Leucine-rich repeat (LRR) protein
MARLKILSLRNTGIGDSGLLHLRDLQDLEILDLTGTYVTDAVLELLRVLPKLRTLYLDDTDTSDAGRFAIRQEFPDLL